VAEALKREGGVIVAPPGSGKTVMAMAIIAAAGQPALCLTHTKDLADQARERAVEFLGLDADEIGMIGGGRWQIGDRLTIGMVQTLAKGMSDEFANRFGLVVLNRLPARLVIRWGDYQAMITALTEDQGRNQLIAYHVISEARAGHFCLVLSDRVAHCKTLADMIRPQ